MQVQLGASDKTVFGHFMLLYGFISLLTSLGFVPGVRIAASVTDPPLFVFMMAVESIVFGALE